MGTTSSTSWLSSQQKYHLVDRQGIAYLSTSHPSAKIVLETSETGLLYFCSAPPDFVECQNETLSTAVVRILPQPVVEVPNLPESNLDSLKRSSMLCVPLCAAENNFIISLTSSSAKPFHV